MVNTSDDVARYYDVNTRAFLRLGVGRQAQVIHRPVWGPGVARRQQALHFVHDRLLEHLDELGGRDAQSMLDLGCGTASSLLYLLDRGVARGAGVSNSRTQLELAQRRIAERGFESRLQLVEGDFCARSPFLFDSDQFDLVFAIEAFSHARSAEAFFENATRYLRSGGRLVIVDDVLVDDRRGDVRVHARTNPAAERWLDDFRRGWHLSSLVEKRVVHRLARRQRLESVDEQDLSGFLRPGAVRRRAVAAAVTLGRSIEQFGPGVALASGRLWQHPRWLNLVGGHGLDRLLGHGLVQYRMHIWRKP